MNCKTLSWRRACPALLAGAVSLSLAVTAIAASLSQNRLPAGDPPAPAARPAASRASLPTRPDPLVPPANGPRKADPTWHAFINATVYPAPGQKIENATVVIRNGRIESVEGTPAATHPGEHLGKPAAEAAAKPAGETPPDASPALALPTSPAPPRGARVWDCRGLTLYAGWIDPFVEVDAPAPAPDSPGLHWNSRVTPQRSALDGRGLENAAAESLRKMGFVAAGIAPRGGIFRGTAAAVSLAKPEDDRQLARPPVYADNVYQVIGFDSGGRRGGGGGEDTGNTNSNWPGYPNSQMGVIALIRQTFSDADWWQETSSHRAGSEADVPSALDALGHPAPADSTRPAPRFFFDVTDELELFRARKIADEFHRPIAIVGCGTEFRRLDGIVELCRGAGRVNGSPATDQTPLVLPLNFPEPPKVASLGQADAVELRDLMTWEQAPTNPRRLEAAGLNVSLTTARLRDRGKFPEQLRKAIRYGLSEDAALSMVTTRPAMLLGVSDLLGAIEPGKVASLIVADGPIFAKKTRLRDVWVDGARYEINPPPSTTLKGEWDVTLEPAPPLPPGVAASRVTFSIDKDNAITIRKYVTKADGAEEVARQSARNVRVDGVGGSGRLSFIFDHDPFGEPGVFVNAGVIEDAGTLIYADGVRATGARFRWTARKIADEPLSDAEAAPKGFAGTWIYSDADGNPVPREAVDAGLVPTIIITPAHELTVQLKDKQVKAERVTVEGKTITIAIPGEPFGEAGTLNSTGTLDADTITGQTIHDDGHKQTWKLSRVKPAAQPGEKKPGGDKPDPAKHADPITGTWTGTASSEGMPQPLPISLKLKLAEGGVVTGSVDAMGQGLEVQGGSFTKSGESDGTLTFTLNPPETDALTVTIDVRGSAATGSAAGGAHGKFTLALTRAPGAAPGASSADDEDEIPTDIPEKISYPFGPYAMADGLPPLQSVLFVNATIWTSGPQGVIPAGYIHIDNGTIKALGPGTIEAPAGVLVIDCAGKHITPGLIDCHSHTGISRGVNESGQAVTAEVRIQDVTDPDSMSWYWQLAGGISVVNNLHGSANPIGGQNCVNKNRWGALTPDDLHFQGAIPGIKFALGENVKQSNWGDSATTRYPKTRMGVETLIRDRFTAAREYLEATKARSHGATKGEEKTALAREVGDGRDQDVSRSDRVATRDGTLSPGVPRDQGDAERRAIRIDDADSSSRGVGAIEHRRRPRTTEYDGLSSLPEDSPRLAGGSDDATRAVRLAGNDRGGPNYQESLGGDGSGAPGPDSIHPSETEAGNEAVTESHSLRGSVASSLRASSPPPRRDLELEALAEILQGQRLIHCHSYRQDEILMLCRVARDFGFKIGTFQHILEGYKVADEVRDHAIGASAFSDWWAYKVEVQDAIPYAGAIMHDVGAVVSFNSDSDELARRMNVEAGKAVKYGNIAPEEALKFVTLNPAKQLKIDDKVGSLEVGKSADLVVWSVPASPASRSSAAAGTSASARASSPAVHHTVDGTPMSVFARCEQTWVDGRQYFSAERDAAMRDANARERSRLLQKLLSTGAKKKDAGKDGDANPAERSGPPGRGRGGRRPTDDLTAGGAGLSDDPDAADSIAAAVSEPVAARLSLLQRMHDQAAEARREFYLNLWRRGIDPTWARCGDCGEAMGTR